MPHSLTSVWTPFHAPLFPSLTDNAVTCIGIRLDENLDACRQATRHYVHETEYMHAQKFVWPIDATRHLVGRALVRRILGQEIGKTASSGEFVLNPWGKPELRGGGLEFSISHSGRWVWAAFSWVAPVGIDIEEIDSLNDLAGLVDALHPAESAAIRRLPPSEANSAFYRCWTRKEAVLKAVGEGLSRPLDSFLVKTEVVSGDWLAEMSGSRAGDWTTADVVMPDDESCHVAVAARALGLSVSAHILT